MIDSVLSPNLATPATPATPAASNVSGPPTANAVDAKNTSAVDQESFASALQARLKLMAANKSAAPAKPVISADIAAKPSDLIPLLAAGQTLPALDMLAQQLKDDKADTDDAGLAQTAAPANTTPLALNTIAPLAMANQGKTATAMSGDGKQTRDVSTLTEKNIDNTTDDRTNNAAAKSAPTAIIAAMPEKNASLTATLDEDSRSLPFSDLLKSAAAGTSANTAPTVAQHAVPANIALPAKEVASPLNSSQWTNEVGDHLSWMVTQHQSRAELVLNPPHLGRIEVSITMNGDQASATFVSGNPEVRDVLQGSLPRLREVLADAGVFLNQANVGAESSSQQFNQQGNGAEKGGKSPGDSFSSSRDTLLGSINGLPLAGTSEVGRGRGLIDLFA